MRLIEGQSSVRVLRNIYPQGIGSCVKQGILAARGDYYLLMDIMSSANITILEKILPNLNNNNSIFIAHRISTNNKVCKKSKFYNLLAQKWLNLNCIDIAYTFKLFQNAHALKIFSSQKCKSYAFHVEIHMLANKHRFKIEKLPLDEKNIVEFNQFKKENFFKILMEFFKIKFYYIFGHYDCETN